MIRFTPYLVRMMICLAVVAALAAALWSGVLQAFLANPGLNGFIIVMFLVGVAYTVRSVFILRPEAA